MSETENESETETEREKKINTEILIAQLEAYRNPTEEKAYELGLRQVWAYYCQRCNYVWLPKDFDLAWNIQFMKPGQTDLGQDLIFTDRKPPKACARCKSRYWNSLWRRQTKHIHQSIHLMETLPRLRALHRKGKLGYKVDGCDCQYCKV